MSVPPVATLVSSIDSQTIQTVAAQRIVFAHQSVGRDILEGVAAVTQQLGQELRISEARSAASEGGIYHFRVGKNRDPEGKLADFVSALSDESMANADVALVKLCYVDFNAGTDPQELAQKYLAALDEVRANRPGTRVVAMTTPLTTVERGPKAWFKKLIGRTPEGYEENLRRQSFNEYLRKRTQADELFDIARIESEATGSLTAFEYKGQQVPALEPSITYDGGHLTEQGKALVASHLLRFLAGSTAARADAAPAPTGGGS